MNYNQLQSLLPNDELHYISDSNQFFIDNQINPSENYIFDELNDFILFEYTISDFSDTIARLKSNNINYTIHTDSYNLDFIII
jgi:hypothetical protein